MSGICTIQQNHKWTENRKSVVERCGKVQNRFISWICRQVGGWINSILFNRSKKQSQHPFINTYPTIITTTIFGSPGLKFIQLPVGYPPVSVPTVLFWGFLPGWCLNICIQVSNCFTSMWKKQTNIHVSPYTQATSSDVLKWGYPPILSMAVLGTYVRKYPHKNMDLSGTNVPPF